MANYANLKAAIDAVIKANGQQEITGTVLNQTLTAMVNSLGAGYQFMGVATPSTNPGTPDQNVFYLAGQAGTYSNFGAIVLQAGLTVLKYNGTWSSDTLFTIDSSITQNSANPITSGAVFEKMKLDGGAYDVSAHNNNMTFASLSALLSNVNLSTLIPTNIRSGGMSIKFISDNMYVQYLYHGTSTVVADFINTDNWEKINLEKEVGQLSNDIVDIKGGTKIVKGNFSIFTRHGYYNASNGSFASSEQYRSTEKIQVNNLTEIKAKALFNDATAAGVVFYNSNQQKIGAVYNQGGSRVSELTITDIPERTAYVAFTTRKADEDSYYELQEEPVGTLNELNQKIENETERATGAEATLQSNIDEIYKEEYNDEVTEYSSSVFSIQNKLLRATTGLPNNQTNYYITDFIELPTGLTKIMAYARFGDNYVAGLCFYDSSQTPILPTVSNVTSSVNAEYTIETPNIPLNAKYIRLTVSTTGITDSYVKLYYTEHTQEGLLVELDDKIDNEIERATNAEVEIRRELNIASSAAVGKPCAHQEVAEFDDGDEIELYNSLAKINNQIIFCGTLGSTGTMGTLKICHGISGYDAGWIEIDDTNITGWNHDSQNRKRFEETHGLTIEDYIGVIWKIDGGGVLTVTLLTRGGIKTVTSNVWWSSNGMVKAISDGCSMTNVSFSYNVDYRKPIWIFGGSFLDVIDTNRWPHYIKEWGFDNYAIFAFPGSTSPEVYQEWLRCLNFGKPKYVLWCLGMNDTENGAMNQNWLTCVQNLIADCEQYGIEVVLSTTPNVPTRNNDYKNNWIKASGKRYFDNAEAVGSYDDPNWYTGMLSQDGVHPTALGAKAMAMRAISDFPEIMQ